MAIQISYPTATSVTLSDRLLGTQYDSETGSAITKNFSIGSIVNLISQPELPYKVFTALLTQGGGSNNIGLYSGTTTIGVTYTIIEDGPLGTGYNFTVIGAPNNNIGTSFIATGTTPIWGIDSAVGLSYNEGAPVATVLENTIGNIWFTYYNTGVYRITSSSLFTINKTFAITSQSGVAIPAKTRIYDLSTGNAIDLSTVAGDPLQPENDVLSDGEEFKTSVEIRVYN